MDITEKINNNITKELEKENKEYIDEIFLFSLKELITESEKKNSLNNNRILNSESLENRDFNIYTTVLDKKEMLFYEKILFPVSEEDLKYKKKIYLKENKVHVDRVFINLSYNEIEDLTDNIYEGTFIWGGKRHNVKFKFFQVKDYIVKINQIYDLFMKNKVAWKTINMPFLYKFFDVMIIDFPPLDLEQETIIENFEYEIKCKNYKIEKNMILLWNIKKNTVVSDLLVRPITERISYEYSINMPDKRKFLLEALDAEINYIYKYKNNVIFVLDRKIDEKLLVYEFIESDYFENSSDFLYGIYNNKSGCNKENGKTKNEILNFLNEINILKEVFTVTDVLVSEPEYKKISSYKLNSFIKNEFDIKDKRKNVFLILSQIKESTFFEDAVSYLISEAELRFKELRILAVLNE